MIPIGKRERGLRYVNGTKGFGILYTVDNQFRLIGYTDSDWVGSLDERKNTCRYMFHMGLGAFSWSSKKKSFFSQSTVEAKYIAVNATVCQAIWLRRILAGLNEK